MNTEDNKTFVRRYLEAIRNDKSASTLDEFIAEDPLKEHIAFFDAAFPGYWLDANDLIADGDKIAVRFTFHGTHKGELMGIAPTGKTATMDGIIIYQIADGKIVDHWMQIDTVSMLQQLGAMPAPA